MRRRPRRAGDARGARAASAARSRCGCAGEKRWIDAADAGLYRDALGAAPPGGLPAAFLEDVPDALTQLVRRYARHPRSVHDRRSARALRGRRRGRAARARARRRRSCAASCAPAAASASGAIPRSCAGCAGLRWPCCARRSSRSTSARSRGSCRRGRASTATRPAGAGVERLREVLVPLQGAGAAGRGLGARRAAAAGRRVLSGWIDQLCAAGEVVWVGAGALGRHSGRVALYFREDLGRSGRRRRGGRARRRTPAHEAVRARLAAGACFFTDLLVDARPRARGAPGGAVGSRLGGRGDQRRVGAAARAAADAGPRAARRAPRARPRRVRFAGAPARAARPRRCRAAGR